MLRSLISEEVFLEDKSYSGVGRVIKEVFGEDDLSQIPKRILEAATERGKKVHEAIESYLLNGEMKINFEYEGYTNAFLDWEKKHSPEYLGVELRIRNDDLKIKGIIDILCRINNKLCIVDTKTTSNLSVFKPMIQLNFYRYLYEHYEQRLEDVESLYILHLTKLGDYEFIKVDMSSMIVDSILYLRKLKTKFK